MLKVDSRFQHEKSVYTCVKYTNALNFTRVAIFLQQDYGIEFKARQNWLVTNLWLYLPNQLSTSDWPHCFCLLS